MTMTISEALTELQDQIIRPGPDFDMHKALEALAVIRSRFEVTDEMVHAAIFEFHRQANGLGLETMETKARRCLKAALVAALGDGK